MNFGDIFRGLFRQPRRDNPPARIDEDDDVGPGVNFFGGQHPFFGGQHPFSGGQGTSGEDSQEEHLDPGSNFHFRFTEADEMMRHFDEMFRSFDEVFRGMGIAQFPSQGPGFPGIDARPPGDDSNLRDRMLKVPDSDSDAKPRHPGSKGGRQLIVPEHSPHQQQPRSFFGGWPTPAWSNKPRAEDRTDSDLDEEVKSGDFGKIFSRHSNPHQMEPSPPPRSLFRGVSVHTFRSADGKAEERKTVQDGLGNDETTVTRSIGDQAHSVTTVTDKDGTQNVKEHYSNMDEKDRPVFDKYWRSPATSRKSNQVQKQQDLNDNSIFNNFFSLNFPGFGSNR